MSRSLESYGKKYLVLYGLCVVFFVVITFDYFGNCEVPRTTKVAFFTMGAGLLAAGARLIVEFVERRKRKKTEDEE